MTVKTMIALAVCALWLGGCNANEGQADRGDDPYRPAAAAPADAQSDSASAGGAGAQTAKNDPAKHGTAQQPAPADPPTGEASAPDAPADAPAEDAAAAGNEWKSLFDGETLEGWKPTAFGGEGEVRVEDGEIILPQGATLTGINYTGEIPARNYEIELEARRRMGNDFFCGITFPVDQQFASFIVGGWGGSLTGISSIDGMDASENNTTKFMKFEKDKWYKIRLRVTDDRLQAWIDDKQVVNVETADRRLTIRIEVSKSKPFGIASWQTEAGLRNIRMRELDAAEVTEKD